MGSRSRILHGVTVRQEAKIEVVGLCTGSSRSFYSIYLVCPKSSYVCVGGHVYSTQWFATMCNMRLMTVKMQNFQDFPRKLNTSSDSENIAEN